MKINHSSLLLIICTLASVNTGYARFPQMDPKAEKYPGISPYAHCDNNPLKYIDPDGKEKIMAVTDKEAGHKEIRSYYNSFGKNDPAIHIWGHGNDKGIMLGGENYKEPRDFETYLNGNSENWSAKKESDFKMIVLHSCETGAGAESFAQKVSIAPEFKDVMIVAPSTKVRITNDSKTITETVARGSAKGLWLIFLNGKQVSSFDGASKPYLNKKNQKNKYKNKLKNTGELKSADDYENEKNEDE